MCKFKLKSGDTRIDPCMKNLIYTLNEIPRFKTLACCCGHKKYAMTVMVYNKKLDLAYEFFSGLVIPREKKFYKRNKKTGIYYIPEVEEYWKNGRKI